MFKDAYLKFTLEKETPEGDTFSLYLRFIHLKENEEKVIVLHHLEELTFPYSYHRVTELLRLGEGYSETMKIPLKADKGVQTALVLFK